MLHTHLKDCMWSMVWLITLLSCGTLPMKALCCRKRHGWFLTWPLCLNTEWWRLVFHKLKKLKFNTSKQVRGFLHSESLYQWLVTASSLDCRCYKPGNPLVANFDECWKPRKTAKNRKPLGNRVWLTHARTRRRSFLARSHRQLACQHPLQSHFMAISPAFYASPEPSAIANSPVLRGSMDPKAIHDRMPRIMPGYDRMLHLKWQNVSDKMSHKVSDALSG
jgi:hypothetical protein